MYRKGLDHEYLPIDGHPSFVKSSLYLGYGEEFVKKNEKRIVGVQSLGGTGALRLAFDFLSRCVSCNPNFNFLKTFFILAAPIYYISSPSLNMHRNLLKDMKIVYKEYRYYDEKQKVKTTNLKEINIDFFLKKSLNFEGMIEDIQKAARNSIIIVQTCSHNPTGHYRKNILQN